MCDKDPKIELLALAHIDDDTSNVKTPPKKKDNFVRIKFWIDFFDFFGRGLFYLVENNRLKR